MKKSNYYKLIPVLVITPPRLQPLLVPVLETPTGVAIRRSPMFHFIM